MEFEVVRVGGRRRDVELGCEEEVEDRSVKIESRIREGRKWGSVDMGTGGGPCKFGYRSVQ
jgi:hypothetical protein